MLPPDERLHAQDLTGLHVELWQVMQYQLGVPAIKGLFQVQFDVVADRFLCGHLRAESCDFSPARTLGRPSGQIGSAQEVRGGVVPGYARGDADADGTGEHLAVDHDLLVNITLQPLSEIRGAVDSHRRGWRNDELVTAEAGDDSGNVNGLAQQLGEGLDESVAGILTEVVIDYLEAVQIKEQKR